MFVSAFCFLKVNVLCKYGAYCMNVVYTAIKLTIAFLLKVVNLYNRNKMYIKYVNTESTGSKPDHQGNDGMCNDPLVTT